MYADVVFPLKIPPLTYKVPPGAPPDLKGRIVKAPLAGRSSYGLIVDVFDKPASSFKTDMKEIQSVFQHFASERDISFLKWLSEYYITPIGIALKSSFFDETIKAANKSGVTKQTVTSRSELTHNGQPASDTGAGIAAPALSSLCNSIKTRTYRSFLFHAPSAMHEYSFLSDILFKMRGDITGVIILVPEIGWIERLESILKPVFGGRLAVLHSKLSKGKKIESIRRIVAGESDIVIGTRSAALAPLSNISFIAVLGEHSQSYKGEEGLRYNGRDVAVMRGYTVKSCVCLSSICPSVESVYNSAIGKYFPVGSPLTLDGRPKIRIIDVKGSKYQDMSISSELVKEAKRIVSNGERLLFLVNRKGYSLIRCDDCGDILKCSKCRMSLVFHKGAGQVRCHYCGFSGKVADTCENCKGANVKPFGAGTERVKEEVEGLLKTEALLIEKNGNQAKIFAEHAPDFTPFVIGTSFAKRLANKKNVPTEASDENSGSGKGSFSAVAFLNMDALLSQPDFRLYERAFQEIAQVAQMVRTDGTIYLQTRMPKNRVLRFIKNYDFDGFYKYELSQRRALDYPPLSKIILINVFMKKEDAEALRHIEGIAVSGAESVEILGPVEIPSSVKYYSHCIQLMLKSRDRKMLHNTAKELLSRIGKLKGIKVNTDVDPLKI